MMTYVVVVVVVRRNASLVKSLGRFSHVKEAANSFPLAAQKCYIPPAYELTRMLEINCW